MLSLSTIRRVKYFTELASSNYYFEGGEPPGRYIAVSKSEAKALGEVTQLSLENLIKGLSRDGKRRLVKSHKRRQPGWDLTFSAPKSVSILYALTPPRIRKAIVEAHQRAVEAAVKYMVREAFLARRGKGGKTFENVEQVIAACFPHITSRAGDPDLHTHTLFANVAKRLDGTYGAIWSREIYKHKMAGGAVYRTELAYMLQKNVGVTLQRVRDWFEVIGISKSVRKHFSQRSEQIRLIAREFGLKSPQFLELVTKISRGVKGHLPHKELFAKWKKEAERFGLNVLTINTLFGGRFRELSQKRADRIARTAAASAIEKLTKQRSYFAERDLVQHAASGVMCKRGGADLLFEAVEVAKRQLIKLDTPGQRYDHYTTMELYLTEKKVLKLAQSYGLSSQHKPVPFSNLLKILDKEFSYGTESQKQNQRRERLNLEAAVRHLVCSGEQIRFITGEQRSGKTTALRLAKQALRASGKDVICCAVTAAGVKELRREVGGDCITVATLLDVVKPSYARRSRHAARQLWRQLRGKSTHRHGEKKLEKEEKIVHYLKNMRRMLQGKLPSFAGKIRLGKNTVLLIDEAEKLDTRTVHELLKVLKKTGTAVRFTLAQDSPTGGGPGGALEHAADIIGAFTLKRDPQHCEAWRRDAHQALRDFNPKRFIRQYRKGNALRQSATVRQAIARIARDWIRDHAKLSEKLVIASSPKEVERINKAIQKARAKRLAVGPRIAGVRVPSGDVICTGDRVRFDRRSRFLGIENGDTGRVLSVSHSKRNPLHKRITVRIDEKTRLKFLPKVVTINTKHYKDLNLGYAVLPHQAEAKVSSVRLLLNPERTTRESLLHQVTRSRKKTKLYTIKPDMQMDVDLLAESLSKQQRKITAHKFEESHRRQQPTMSHSL